MTRDDRAARVTNAIAEGANALSALAEGYDDIVELRSPIDELLEVIEELISMKTNPTSTLEYSGLGFLAKDSDEAGILQCVDQLRRALETDQIDDARVLAANLRRRL